MVACIPDSPRRGSGSFQRVADAFLARQGLPFAEILSAERIERVFAQHGCLFGLYGIYTVAVMVWAFLSQVLRDGKVAADMEAAADPTWLWKGRLHPKLIDGFTFTMPDTAKNQAQYPQPASQKRGVGLPIARVVAILSLATACVMDLALGPYKGQETGEPALLRSLLGSLARGDIAVADRYYCSFLMIALLLGRGIQTSLNLGHVRCKSPEMVRRGLWTTILGYNLIRTTAAGAALVHGKQPRQISFTSTCQYVLASWMQLSSGLIPPARLDPYVKVMLTQIAECEVGNRPGRLEPRVLKRRRHGYPLMQRSRAVLRAELRRHAT